LSLFTGGLGIVVHDEGFVGWSHAWSHASSFSGRKRLLYSLALALALILLWLDLHYHPINK
jgi:hypothetical protein